jgi:hypothetical protein
VYVQRLAFAGSDDCDTRRWLRKLPQKNQSRSLDVLSLYNGEPLQRQTSVKALQPLREDSMIYTIVMAEHSGEATRNPDANRIPYE